MLIDLLLKKTNFSNNEKVIADYILEHQSSIIDLTAQGIADRTYTSKSTVIRLCKKVGCKGYKEFQKNLLLEFNLYEKTNKTDKPVNNHSTLKDVASSLPRLYDSLIENTYIQLDYKQLERIIKKLLKSSYIEIYGTGISYSLALDCAFKFNSIGINAQALSGLNEHSIETLVKVQRNPVAIIISFTGNNKNMCSIASVLRKSGVYVIGTGEQNGILAKYCSEYMQRSNEGNALGLEAIVAQTSTRYLLDLLFVSLITYKYDTTMDASLLIYNRRNEPK